MTKVVITKAGLFEDKWSGKKQENVRRRIKKSRIWTHLRNPCEIEEGVTLLDIFRAVSRYKMLSIFMSQYSWCRDIDAFHAQAEEPDYSQGEEKDPDEEMTHLEIHWSCEYAQHDKRYMQISPSFHGVGPARGSRIADGDENGLIHWAIDFSPVYSLAHLPVVLNENVEFFEILDFNKPIKPIAKDRKPIVFANRSFSLQEVLDAIYWEISFVGGPQQKTEMLDMLKARVQEIEDGTVETFPMDDIPEDGKKKIVIHPDVLNDLGELPAEE